MPITVVGSIAFDTVATPFGTRERMVGAAATPFALAASFFDVVRVDCLILNDADLQDIIDFLRRKVGERTPV